MTRPPRILTALVFVLSLAVATFVVDTDGWGVGVVTRVLVVAMLLTVGLHASHSFLRDGLAEGLAAAFLPRRPIPRGADGYSAVQSLEMRGEGQAALERAAELLALAPSDPVLCFLVVELYLRHGRTRSAVHILRRLRLDATVDAGDRLRASNRLVDIHGATPGERGLACRELRSILRQYPTSRAASGAAALLQELEPEQERDSEPALAAECPAEGPDGGVAGVADGGELEDLAGADDRTLPRT